VDVERRDLAGWQSRRPSGVLLPSVTVLLNGMPVLTWIGVQNGIQGATR
jgi:hypothetical protein